MIPDAHLQKLRALPMGVCLPAHVPSGFAVADVQAEEDPDYGAFYRIVLVGPTGELFVEGTNGGLGDVMRGESRQRFVNPHLGEGTVEFYEPDSEEGVDFRSHWLQAHPEMPAYGIAGKGVDPAEAVRVAESLAPLE